MCRFWLTFSAVKDSVCFLEIASTTERSLFFRGRQPEFVIDALGKSLAGGWNLFGSSTVFRNNLSKIGVLWRNEPQPTQMAAKKHAQSLSGRPQSPFDSASTYSSKFLCWLSLAAISLRRRKASREALFGVVLLRLLARFLRLVRNLINVFTCC